jgi:septal ring factor EnvC (AmiA/AmiB activator)
MTYATLRTPTCRGLSAASMRPLDTADKPRYVDGLNLCGLTSLFFCLLLFVAQPINATAVNHLKEKIHQLKNQLQADHKGLSETEKKLHQQETQIALLQKSLAQTKQKIVTLQAQLQPLELQYQTQQKLLMQHLNARYHIQTTPSLLQQRFFTYYQYILQSDVAIFKKIMLMKAEIDQQQSTLKTTLQQQVDLEKKLNQQQLALLKQKQVKQSSLHKVEHDLQLEQNKLNTLFKKLSEQRFQNVHVSLATMHHKWPWPIQQNGLKYTKVNQGMLLSAREGEPVHAVLPGKILFSHWFNGYGYLIIIDHGRGYYSLYANNQKLYKPEGAYVIQGETIASVGHSGNLKQNGLYFELRHLGKAVSPLAWLA